MPVPIENSESGEKSRVLRLTAYVPAPLRKVLHLFRFVPLKVKRRGIEMRLIINGAMSQGSPILHC
jgi:hypothetical protein